MSRGETFAREENVRINKLPLQGESQKKGLSTKRLGGRGGKERGVQAEEEKMGLYHSLW